MAKENHWEDAEWEEMETNIKHSGVYPSGIHTALEKKLKQMLSKGIIKSYRIKRMQDF